MESTSPEMLKLFNDPTACRLVGRVRCPRWTYEQSFAAVVELGFRGTDRVANWATNINTFLVQTTIGEGHGKVHQGFQVAYLSLKQGIFEHIDAALEKHGVQTDLPVLVRATGHSLGGALATLCAYDLKCARKNWEVRCVTWGSPRLGNGEFASACRKALPKYGRYINKMDLPSCLPSNPKDPYDYQNPVRSLLSGSSSPFMESDESNGFGTCMSLCGTRSRD